jgi:hypothetical protein
LTAQRASTRIACTNEEEAAVAARKPDEKPDLTPDAAAPPPGEPPDTISIYGILGESTIASSVRLYLERGMSTYYDIPIEGIAGREKIPADQSPLGVDSTLLAVRKGIRLVVHHVDTRTVEDEFLSGDFTAPGSFTPAPGGPGAPGGPVQIPVSQICPTNIGCTFVACGGTQTAATTCTQFACHTQLLGCGTATVATACFSHVPCAGTIATHAATVCRPSLGIACTVIGCPPVTCAANTIHPTIWTQLGTCDTGCVAHTIRPTLWTQIGCPPHSGFVCPSVVGPCPGGGGPGGGDPGPEF